MARDHQYNKLIRTLLRSIRGKRTQKDLSRILGFKFNQWHKWESGLKVLTWSDLVNLCKTLELPLDLAVNRVLGDPDFPVANGPRLIREIQDKYLGRSGSQTSVAGLSPSKRKRIFSGKQEPDLALILQILDEHTSSLPIFLDALCPNFDEPRTQRQIRAIKQQLRNEADTPWLSAVEAALETRIYKFAAHHEDEIISTLLGLPRPVVVDALKTLAASGAIELKDGKYALSVKRVDMEGDLSASARLARFWTALTLHRFDTPDGIPSSRRGWTYRIFPVSAQAQQELREAVRQLSGRITESATRDRDREKTSVQVLMMHLFDDEEIRSQKLLGKNIQKRPTGIKSGY